jgi:hypothetical protein
VALISSWFVEAANHTSGEFPPDVDEWEASGLTPEPSVKVQPSHLPPPSSHLAYCTACWPWALGHLLGALYVSVGCSFPFCRGCPPMDALRGAPQGWARRGPSCVPLQPPLLPQHPLKSPQTRSVAAFQAFTPLTNTLQPSHQAAADQQPVLSASVLGLPQLPT